MWNYRMLIPLDAADELNILPNLRQWVQSTNHQRCWFHGPEAIYLADYEWSVIGFAGDEPHMRINLAIRLYGDRSIHRNVCDWTFIEAHAVQSARLPV